MLTAKISISTAALKPAPLLEFGLPESVFGYAILARLRARQGREVRKF
jgi:hypothetical protein